MLLSNCINKIVIINFLLSPNQLSEMCFQLNVKVNVQHWGKFIKGKIKRQKESFLFQFRCINGDSIMKTKTTKLEHSEILALIKVWWACCSFKQRRPLRHVWNCCGKVEKDSSYCHGCKIFLGHKKWPYVKKQMKVNLERF